MTLNAAIDRALEVADFTEGAALKARLLHVQPAGKGFNVSRCLASLAARSLAVGFVGRKDEPLYRDSFDARFVELALILVEQPTRVNVTIRNRAKGSETHLREEGPTVSREQWTSLLSVLEARAVSGDVVAFCGSLPPGLDDGDLGEAIRRAQQQGARVAVDCHGSALRRAVAESLWLVKPNRLELAELAGASSGTHEAIAAAARSLADRVQIVMTSLGADGIVLSTASGAWLARSPVPAVRNTVGPGDASLAGFLAAQERGEPLEEVLRWAVACGGASVQADSAGRLDPDVVARQRQAAVLKRLA